MSGSAIFPEGNENRGRGGLPSNLFLLFRFCSRAAAAGFVNCLFSAAGISLAAQLALGRERARTLFARPRFGLGKVLAFGGEAQVGHAAASAAGALDRKSTCLNSSHIR